MSKSIQVLGVAAALIFVRVVYVWLEGAYNVALLDLVSTQQLTSQQADSVQLLGHKLAAIGFALLATPLLIGFAIKGVSGAAKQWGYGVSFGVVGFSAIYIGAYHLQTWAMDTAVESTSAETRYEAYYSAIFRQLYIDGNIVDEGFSPSPQVAAQVMWLPFGANSTIDLPAQLQNDAADIVVERARKQLALERFEKDYRAYLSYQNFTQAFLADYRRYSDEAIAKADPTQYTAANLYGSVTESIYAAYAGYQRISDSYAKHSNYMAQNGWFVRDVMAIFTGSENERQWMHNALLKIMEIEGGWLSIDDWCAEKRCPGSPRQIRQAIQSALSAKYQAAARGVPMGLSLSEVLQSHEAFNVALARSGVPARFDQSPVTWDSFRDQIDSTALRPDISPLLVESYPKLHGSVIPAGMSDQQLTNSPEFTRIVAAQMGERVAQLSPALSKDEFFAEWLSATNENLDRNRAALLPDDPAQMEDASNLEAGYSAVRLLYIPPIAAALSAAMIILNIAAIGSNLVSLGASSWLFRLFSVAALVVVGYSIGGSVGMPTHETSVAWAGYQESAGFMSALWQVLFGVEYLVGSTAALYDVFLPSSEINALIEKGLGWVL